MFTDLDPRKLALLFPADMRILKDKFAEEHHLSYHQDWFFRTKERCYKVVHYWNKTNPSGEIVKLKFCSLEDFPTTMQEVGEFRQQIMRESVGDITITNKADLQSSRSKPVTSLNDFKALVCHSLDGTIPKSKMWRESLSRNVLLYIKLCLTNVLEEVVALREELDAQGMLPSHLQAAADMERKRLDEMEQELDLMSFMSVVCQKFLSPSRRRRPHSDKSEAIIWHTTLTNQYRVDENRTSRPSAEFFIHPLKLLPAASTHTTMKEDEKKRLSPGFLGEGEHSRFSMVFVFSANEEVPKIAENLFTEPGARWSFFVQLRVRVILALAYYDNDFPIQYGSRWKSRFLNDCALTTSTRLHHFSPKESAYNNAIKSIYATKFKLAKARSKKCPTIDFEKGIAHMRQEFGQASRSHANTGKYIEIALFNRNLWSVPDLDNDTAENRQIFLLSLFNCDATSEAKVNRQLRQSENLHNDVQMFASKGLITKYMIDLVGNRVQESYRWLKRHPTSGKLPPKEFHFSTPVAPKELRSQGQADSDSGDEDCSVTRHSSRKRKRLLASLGSSPRPGTPFVVTPHTEKRARWGYQG